ncbi:MAG: GT-D fold domain-containing glycosyltransferase [Lachnospiraceae bacterium]
MFKIIIFGAGQSLNPVLKSVVSKEIIQGLLDNSADKIGTIIDGMEIASPNEISHFQYDYVVIATLYYKMVEEQLEMLGVSKEQIILFYREDIDFSQYKDIFDVEKAQWQSFHTRIDVQMKDFIKKQKIAMKNIEYEIAENMLKEKYQFPTIISEKDTVEKIINEKLSVSRYGEGEFEIMAGHATDPYQIDNKDLAQRLKEILVSNVNKHIVAIAADYGNLQKYNESLQYGIRKYMTEETREFHYSVLDMKKIYYNAYISRPYSIYKHEKTEEAVERFYLLKKIWEKQEIVFIEGTTTRMGVGNNLFDNAKSIERIIAPEKNAFHKYNKILEAAKKFNKKKLFIIALGQTATVLAYDLALAGFWAIDTGHMDLEYEWLLKGRGPTYIPNKYNNEVYGDEQVVEVDDAEYYNQIKIEI